MNRVGKHKLAGSNPIAPGRRRFMVALAAGTILLAACGPRQPMRRGERDSDDDLPRFVRRGYNAGELAATDAFRETWPCGNDEVVLDFLLPQGGTPCPLVIYLPGLGEPVEAGLTWRTAWAQGGYAVVSVQTVKAAAVWASREARSGDAMKVAREAFSAEALARRIDCLALVRQEIARRAAAGSGRHARIDTARIAIAGFDLGAQTALALAGETHPGLPELPEFPGLRAAIALSPLALPSGDGGVERFATIDLPNLTITATGDEDPYGLVDSPDTRQAPFKLMQPGDKYLLVLADGSHQLLSGSMAARPPRGDAQGGRGRRGGGSEAQGGRPSPEGMGGPGGGRGGPPGDDAGQRVDAKGAQRRVAIVEHVSRAFLDATLRSDPVAREWLTRNAPGWSDPLARLETK